MEEDKGVLVYFTKLPYHDKSVLNKERDENDGDMEPTTILEETKNLQSLIQQVEGAFNVYVWFINGSDDTKQAKELGKLTSSKNFPQLRMYPNAVQGERKLSKSFEIDLKDASLNDLLETIYANMEDNLREISESILPNMA